MSHVFDINRVRRIPNVICDCADLTAPDGHLYTQDEVDVTQINSPDGSLQQINWGNERKNKFRKSVWESIRTTGIGGSETGVLLGDSHWQTKLGLYYDKIGQLPLIDAPEPESAKQYLFDFGHYMEEFIADQFQKLVFWERYKEIFELAFSEKYGEDITIVDVKCYRDTKMYRCPEVPCLLADFDFLIRFTLKDGRHLEGIFECKTSSPYQITEKWERDFPASYNDQVNHYMLVGDYDFFVIACAADNNYKNFYAHLGFRDSEMDKKIIDCAKDFWYNCVAKKQPPTDLNEDVQSALLTYEEIADGSVADFSKFPFVQAQLKGYLEKKEQASQYKALADEASKEAEVFKSNIARLLQGRERGVLGAATENGAAYEIVYSVTRRTLFGTEQRTRLLKDRPDLKDVIGSYCVTSNTPKFTIRRARNVPKKSKEKTKQGA